jgi:YtkA-like
MNFFTRGFLFLVSALTAGFAMAAQCGASIATQGRQVVSSGDYSVSFAPSVWPLPVGQFFSIDVAICAASGAGVKTDAKPTNVRVDADMPAHKHGMNYTPVVAESGEGSFTAEGLMFHMPGVWRVTVEFTAQKKERFQGQFIVE